jgi:HTH-type transcriptional regulator/antitoxin HigA
MKHTIINAEEQYEAAMERLNELFDADPSTIEGQEAHLLALLIEDYEEQHYRIEAPDPIVVIKIRMEEMLSCLKFDSTTQSLSPLFKP